MRLDAAHFRHRDACPVCRGSAREILYTAPLSDGDIRSFLLSHYSRQGTIDWSILDGTDFALAECADCRLVYQIAEPRDATMEAIYTRMIDASFLRDYEDSQLGLESFHRIAGELSVLFAMTGKPPSQIRFLDFGFGYGRYARVARGMGAIVYGTEIGADKHEQAAALGVVCLTDAQVDAMRFDIVHTEQVFEHVGDPAGLFARLSGVTDGLLKVAVPAGKGVAATVRRKGFSATSPFGRQLEGLPAQPDDPAYMAAMPLEHINVFMPETMARLARDNDMRIVSTLRRQSVSLDLSGPRRAMSSAAAVAKEIARLVVRPQSGYYIFAPGA